LETEQEENLFMVKNLKMKILKSLMRNHIYFQWQMLALIPMDHNFSLHL
jgi:hypothetical protein